MSTERPSFGLNSILPTAYMSKAEAFAKSLQDRLRTLGGGDESAQQKEDTFSRFTDEEIADNVFLQGPLSYKRRSIPEHPEKNSKTRFKCVTSVVDKRGMSSDSEDSASDDNETTTGKKLTWIQHSLDSTSSWASCEEGPDPEEDEEVADALALQVKGSPPSRMRNFRRKVKKDERIKKEKEKEKEKPVENVEQDTDLFFDFDVECFSPVSVEEEEDLRSEKSQDTGQFLQEPRISLTPPPSPANENGFNNGDDIVWQNANSIRQSVEDHQPESETPSTMNESLKAEQQDEKAEYNQYYRAMFPKDSGICSCEETSSRTGDEDSPEKHTCEMGEDALSALSLEQKGESEKEETGAEERVMTQESSFQEPKPVMVMCEGVLIDESYLPSPRMKLRRCSSLKTWKTPPGTPGRKKIVRFADALGLDLADVRTFLDDIPKIPNSAFQDLHYQVPPAPPPPTTERTLIPMFQQPGTQIDFLQKVRENNVCLESALLTDVILMSIAGIVRVRNLSFHKAVHVRYTKDNWATFSDLQATFVPNSSDGFCDNFSFTLYGHTLNIGDRLEFAIRYDCSSGQFWDNNQGQNYVFQCMPRSNMTLFPPLGSSPLDSWNKFY